MCVCVCVVSCTGYLGVWVSIWSRTFFIHFEWTETSSSFLQTGFHSMVRLLHTYLVVISKKIVSLKWTWLLRLERDI